MSKNNRSWPSLRNQDWKTVKAETEKNGRIMNTYPNEQHHEIKRTNLCRIEIILRKMRCSSKEHERKIKTWMWNSTGNAGKKSTTTNKNDKTEGERWTMLGQKEKAIRVKLTIQLEEINQNVLAKEERLKRYRNRENNTDKTGYSKTMIKNLPASRGRMHKDTPTTG